MTKELTVRQMASIKRVAQNVNPLVTKKNKIISKLDELREEYDSVCNEINGHEMGVISLTGGFTSECLVEKRIEDTGKIDKEGKPVKVTKYEPRTDVVRFNQEKNVYEILLPEPVEFEEIAENYKQDK
jgi:hypothetical protein